MLLGPLRGVDLKRPHHCSTWTVQACSSDSVYTIQLVVKSVEQLAEQLCSRLSNQLFNRFNNRLITWQRRYGFAKYWKHFMARLNRVHTFSYNCAGSKPIWMKFGALWVHCLPLALADFGCDQRRSEPKFCFFVRYVTRHFTDFRQPNFTKFAHNFENFPVRGHVFPKKQLFGKNLQRLPTSGPHNSLTI